MTHHVFVQLKRNNKQILVLAWWRHKNIRAVAHGLSTCTCYIRDSNYYFLFFIQDVGRVSAMGDWWQMCFGWVIDWLWWFFVRIVMYIIWQFFFQGSLTHEYCRILRLVSSRPFDAITCTTCTWALFTKKARVVGWLLRWALRIRDLPFWNS